MSAQPAPMTVSCNDCGRDFAAVPVEEPTHAGGARMTMTCPHCEGLFPIMHITKRGLKLRRRLAEARARGDAAAARKLLAQMQKQITRTTR